MNEKFAEISLAVGGSHYPSINPQLQQRFGEMIVEECLTLLDSIPENNGDRSTLWIARKAIADHFGVKA